jgi:hypothetical protein
MRGVPVLMIMMRGCAARLGVARRGVVPDMGLQAYKNEKTRRNTG